MPPSGEAGSPGILDLIPEFLDQATCAQSVGELVLLALGAAIIYLKVRIYRYVKANRPNLQQIEDISNEEEKAQPVKGNDAL